MREISPGIWIGLGMFLAFILILMEVQLWTIRSLLQELRNHFIAPNRDARE